MKSKIVFSLLLVSIFLIPGCYTVLRVTDATEIAHPLPAPTVQPIVEYIPEYVPVYIPEPVPEPLPQPVQYLPPALHVDNNPPSAPANSDERREIRTGRGHLDSNPAPVRNDDNNTGTRDSGTQRGRR